MMTNPRQGQRVRCWYRKAVCHLFPLHGQIGTVVYASRGKPRNHCVEVDGVRYSVPCGNLRWVPARNAARAPETGHKRRYVCLSCGSRRFGAAWCTQFAGDRPCEHGESNDHTVWFCLSCGWTRPREQVQKQGTLELVG